MKKKIILHGHLAEKYPHEIAVEAASVAEAIRSLQTIEELTPPSGLPWPVTVEGVSNEIALFCESDLEEIHVYPQTSGAKKGGLVQVLLGIALIGIAIMNPGLAFLGMTAGSLFLSGGLMIVGGLLQMMSPTPEGAEAEESSKYLGAAANSVAIGTRIPLAYGNNRLGGHYLSFDVDAIDWSGEEETNGAATLVKNNLFVEYDKTPVAGIPINPVFTSPILSATNIPEATWTP